MHQAHAFPYVKGILREQRIHQAALPDREAITPPCPGKGSRGADEAMHEGRTEHHQTSSEALTKSCLETGLALCFKHGTLGVWVYLQASEGLVFSRDCVLGAGVQSTGLGCSSPQCATGKRTAGPSYTSDFIEEKRQSDRSDQSFYWGGDPWPGTATAAFQPCSHAGWGANPLWLQEWVFRRI